MTHEEMKSEAVNLFKLKVMDSYGQIGRVPSRELFQLVVSSFEQGFDACKEAIDKEFTKSLENRNK